MAETLISPGVLARENDQSFVTAQPTVRGAAIVGPTAIGPVERPTLISSFSSFQAIFGSSIESGSNEYTYLTSIAANQYFQNGGTSLLVTRVTSGSYLPALSTTIQNNIESTNAGLIGSIDPTLILGGVEGTAGVFPGVSIESPSGTGAVATVTTSKTLGKTKSGAALTVTTNPATTISSVADFLPTNQGDASGTGISLTVTSETGEGTLDGLYTGAVTNGDGGFLVNTFSPFLNVPLIGNVGTGALATVVRDSDLGQLRANSDPYTFFQNTVIPVPNSLLPAQGITPSSVSPGLLLNGVTFDIYSSPTNVGVLTETLYNGTVANDISAATSDNMAGQSPFTGIPLDNTGAEVGFGAEATVVRDTSLGQINPEAGITNMNVVTTDATPETVNGVAPSSVTSTNGALNGVVFTIYNDAGTFNAIEAFTSTQPDDRASTGFVDGDSITFSQATLEAAGFTNVSGDLIVTIDENKLSITTVSITITDIGQNYQLGDVVKLNFANTQFQPTNALITINTSIFEQFAEIASGNVTVAGPYTQNNGSRGAVAGSTLTFDAATLIAAGFGAGITDDLVVTLDQNDIDVTTTSVTITTPGSGYELSQTLQIDLPNGNGQPQTSTIIVDNSIFVAGSGNVSGVTITTNLTGSGYAVGDVLQVSQAQMVGINGANGDLEVTLQEADVVNTVSSVVITTDGAGYTDGETGTITSTAIGSPTSNATFEILDSMIENRPAFVLETISEGEIMNNTSPIDSDTSGTELSNGALISGSNNNVRWQITSVNTSSGVFSLAIRRGNDTATRPVVLETYNNISLDPFSSNYISRAIGDVSTTVVTEGGDTFLQESGSYTNISAYVRVKSVDTPTPNYFNNNGIAKSQFTASLPQVGSGSFDLAAGSNIPSGRAANFYQNINGTDTQGLVGDDYDTAIALLSNQDAYQYNVISVPGLYNQAHASQITSITNTAISRGDNIAVIDLVGYNQQLATVVNQAASTDNSYTATYWPWLQTVDPNSGQLVFIPASTFIPGVFAFTDASSDPWFAPAGITRGGMGQVVRAERRLTSANRDTLYEANINPIATFPNQGVVVFGQKTLQKAASALDRINVRRLLITLKDYISQIADNLVFEQNTIATRQNFLTQVNPYLESVQQRQGLYAFKVVMDETNNTPDVVDRNELIGQIFLQPTRTAEFILLDFNVLPTGATFPA
tara:strand:- start:19 stop:3597 length:3579 start_codon:yes stop_codon:yes gene_type:complete